MEEHQRKKNRKNPWRFAFGALAVFAAFKLLGYIAAWLIGEVFGGISFPASNAASLGIIGGADGPTAVFVTAASVPVWRIILMILLFAAGIRGFRRLSRCEKE